LEKPEFEITNLQSNDGKVLEGEHMDKNVEKELQNLEKDVKETKGNFVKIIKFDREIIKKKKEIEMIKEALEDEKQKYDIKKGSAKG
jgi:hypothetical protein